MARDCSWREFKDWIPWLNQTVRQNCLVKGRRLSLDDRSSNPWTKSGHSDPSACWWIVANLAQRFLVGSIDASPTPVAAIADHCSSRPVGIMYELQPDGFGWVDEN